MDTPPIAIVKGCRQRDSKDPWGGYSPHRYCQGMQAERWQRAMGWMDIPPITTVKGKGCRQRNGWDWMDGYSWHHLPSSL